MKITKRHLKELNESLKKWIYLTEEKPLLVDVELDVLKDTLKTLDKSTLIQIINDIIFEFLKDVDNDGHPLAAECVTWILEKLGKDKEVEKRFEG